MEEKKKGIFGRAIDALTNRDEKEALEKAKAEVAAVKDEAAELRAKLGAEKAAADRAAYYKTLTEKKVRQGVVNVKSLRVRKDHSTDSEMVDGLVFGNKVTIIDTWTDGKNTWAKLAPDQWAAMIYNGETFIKEG